MPGGFSLGAKFVGLTAGLILLLSITALISLRNSAETVGQIKTVVESAIPAYGALARSHIRSLEQAVELRRALLAAEDPAQPDSELAEHIDTFLAARAGYHRQIENGERLLDERWIASVSGSALSGLAPLRDKLVELKTLTETYDRETDACLAAIRARSISEARRRLDSIDDLRDQLGEALESVRAGMFTVLQTVSKDAQAAQARAQTATIVVFVLSSILGLSVAAVAAVRLIRSIRSIVRGAEAVEGGDLDTRIEIASRDEIGRLAASFNRMTEGLRMRDLIRDTLGKYVDRRIAEQLIGSRTALVERGERREVAVMFCDLAGFTSLSEQVEPERLVRFLNEYFSLLAREIAATDGIIDKYIGDAVMAYWCPPFVPREEVALRSGEAALRCLGQIEQIVTASREIFQAPVLEPRIRVGIATGESITGSIGAKERRNYTVIGDTVNLASRVEGANRLYRTTSLVCRRTAEAIRGKFELREVDTVLLPGIEEPQEIFEIMGRLGAISPEQRDLRLEYSLALTAYRKGDGAAARHHFSRCLVIAPDDGPARTMLERLEALPTTLTVVDGGSRIWRLKKDDLP